MNQVESLLSGQSQNSLLNTVSVNCASKDSFRLTRITPSPMKTLDSTNSSYQFFEGLWQYKHLFPERRFPFRQGNTMKIYDPQGLLPGHDQLTSDASLALSRPVLQFMQMTLMLDMSDIRDNKQGNTDLLFFRSNLSARFNKLTITLNGQSSWRFFGSSLSRDDYVRLDVVRYF